MAKKNLIKKYQDSLIEAGKELLRVVLIAIVPLVIVQLESNALDWKALAVVGAIAFLRGLDKFLHLEGKANGNTKLEKGLTRF